MPDIPIPSPSEKLEVSPSEVSTWLAQNPSDVPPIQLVDCREEDEFAICGIAGATRLPLSQFPDVTVPYTEATPPETVVIVYCHHGMRSLHATQFLRASGLTNTFSLAGGIDAWSQEIDPAVRRY